MNRQLPNPVELFELMQFKKPELNGKKRRLDAALTTQDLRRIAKRRTPVAAFDYTDGGAEAEISMQRARQAFEDIEFHPDILRPAQHVDTSTTVLGGLSALPFGIAPTGFTRLMQTEGEVAGAGAAGAAGIPFTLSTLGTTSIEHQMLGNTVADPDGIEGTPGTSAGLGHLDVATVLTPQKELRVESATSAIFGLPLAGYHMHMGATEGPDRVRPFAHVGGGDEGAVSASGRVMGTYLHGIFASDAFRRAFLERLGIAADPMLDFNAEVDATLDALAAHLETHLDLDAILALAEPRR